MSDVGVFMLIGAIIADSPPLPRAACRNLAPGFDGDPGVDVAIPLAICRSCPERTPCSMWARTAQLTGVVGGQVHYPRQQRESA